MKMTRHQSIAEVRNARKQLYLKKEKLEKEIKDQYLQIEGGISYLRIPPDIAGKISSFLINKANHVLEEDDNMPVLACETTLRYSLYRMLRRFDKRIHVIGYTELSPEVSAEIRYELSI